MYLFFADDAMQRRPSRPGMGVLAATGGISIPAQDVRTFEWEIHALCKEYGFPNGQEFKWSPGKDHWMHEELVEQQRRQFFTDVLSAAINYNAQAIVVIEDTSSTTATGAADSSMDTTTLLLERVNLHFGTMGTEGIVIVDQPGGGRKAEERYHRHCLEQLQQGTNYVQFDHILMNVLSTPSHFSRLLQVADLVTSCTLAVVAGEQTFAPPIFEMIKPLLCRELGRIGGVGLKLFPDTYINLYYWLLGDQFWFKGSRSSPMPVPHYPYYSDPMQL